MSSYRKLMLEVVSTLLRELSKWRPSISSTWQLSLNTHVHAKILCCEIKEISQVNSIHDAVLKERIYDGNKDVHNWQHFRMDILPSTYLLVKAIIMTCPMVVVPKANHSQDNCKIDTLKTSDNQWRCFYPCWQQSITGNY